MTGFQFNIFGKISLSFFHGNSSVFYFFVYLVPYTLCFQFLNTQFATLIFQIIYEHALYENRDTVISNLDNNVTMKKLLTFVARQFVRREMILDVDWLGSDKGVFYESGFGTDMGLCDWITPNMTFEDVKTTSLRDNQPGTETGLKNGLTLMLDGETFDYGIRGQE